MADYKYTPLDEEAGEIRLLTLLPGRFNAPICITLETKILSIKKIPKFTALSYAWGSDLDCLNIHVVAKRGVQGVKSATLSVTRNLFEGLKHLRQKRRATVLWIDQLCVDQRNLEERAKQVLRMPDIYSLAKGVIVWLGPESADSNLAMKIFNDIGQDVTVDWERKRLGIHPDYTISAPDVFENLVLQRLKYNGTLSMLRFCSTKHRFKDIPSWVPDWSAHHKITPFAIGPADLYARAHAYSVSKGVLAVTGVRVTVVHEVKNDLPRSIPEDRTKSAKVFQQLLSTWVGQDHSDSRLSKLHSLCVTLCAGMFSEKYIPSNHSYPTFKEAHDYITRLYEISLLKSAEPPELCSSSLQVIRTINMMTEGRLLITTADSRLGLAPEGTISGDLVCVILGCPSPLILRSNNNLNHEVAGECYIDGTMAGEALLGKLPRNQMLVRKHFPDHRSYFNVFIDSAMGKTHLQDPRLGPLPAGWRIENHDKDDAFNWYVNDITGEVARIRDPRLEPDALRARGVEIQEFRLV
ncbi:MAG: hypothetical protein Q9199_006815 [Rusavskia elegans]